MAKDTLKPHKLKRTMKEAEECEAWQRMVYKKAPGEDKAAAQRRQQEYKDRAEERRQKNKAEPGSIAIDGLVRKFEQIRQVEEEAEEAEAGRTEMPTMEAHREGNMGVDGSFLGTGGMERAGIGFGSGSSASLIP